MSTKTVSKRKEEIMTVAMELFVEKGFLASVNDLVKRIGIAKGTFYHHFTEKEALIVDIYKELMFEVEANCVTPYADENPRDYNRKVFGQIVKWFISHPTKYYYITIFETSPYVKSTLGRIEETLEHPRQIIMQKVDMGILKAYPTDMIAFFDFSFTRGAANYFLSQRNPLQSFDAEFDAAFDMYWAGVARLA
jgi:AcrR family transcriptional regulator